MQHYWISGFILASLLMSETARAATLEIPTSHTTLSGIGVISGWKCAAGELTVRFDGGDPVPLVYGSKRKDVLRERACDHDLVGFVSIMNWGELGDGPHTAVVYDDGVEFDRSSFNVVTTGEAFLRSAAGQCIAPDFPAPNENARFIWSQPTQHMELAEVGGAELLPVVEECEETTCPVCEVCRECPPVEPRTPLATPYDGTWSGPITLTGDLTGACAAWGWEIGEEDTHTFTVSNHKIPTVAHGLRGSPDSRWFSSFGTVSASGRVDVETYESWHDDPETGQSMASFTGRLSGQSGAGSWFNVFGCSARWTATKQ